MNFQKKVHHYLQTSLYLMKKKCENGQIIIGLDDIKILPFLNDIKKDQNMDILMKNYYKIKEELGYNELTELYLIDINRLL